MTPDINIGRASTTDIVVNTPEGNGNQVEIRGVNYRPVETIINGVTIIFWEPKYGQETWSVFEAIPESEKCGPDGKGGQFSIQIHPKNPNFNSSRGGYNLHLSRPVGSLAGKLVVTEYGVGSQPWDEILNTFGGVHCFSEGKHLRQLSENNFGLNESLLEFTDEDPLCLIPFRRKNFGFGQFWRGGVIAVHRSVTKQADFWLEVGKKLG